MESIANPVVCVGTHFIPNAYLFSGLISRFVIFLKGKNKYSKKKEVFNLKILDNN